MLPASRKVKKEKKEKKDKKDKKEKKDKKDKRKGKGEGDKAASLGYADNVSEWQWAVLQFETPVIAPLHR